MASDDSIGGGSSPSSTPSGISILSIFTDTILASPFNLALCLVCVFLIYRLWRNSSSSRSDQEESKIPPPLEPHDMDWEELKKYNGRGPDGRVCIAINGKVFDCSKADFYRPGGPYATFAGRDATRGLAKFDVYAVSDEWDDHSDISIAEWSSVQEWELQFTERYQYVGKLFKELPNSESSPSGAIPKDAGDEDRSGNEAKSKDD